MVEVLETGKSETVDYDELDRVIGALEKWQRDEILAYIQSRYEVVDRRL